MASYACIRAVRARGVAEFWESARHATSSRWKSAVVTTNLSNYNGQLKGFSGEEASTASLLVCTKARHETSRGPRRVEATF